MEDDEMNEWYRSGVDWMVKELSGGGRYAPDDGLQEEWVKADAYHFALCYLGLPIEGKADKFAEGALAAWRMMK